MLSVTVSKKQSEKVHLSQDSNYALKPPLWSQSLSVIHYVRQCSEMWLLSNLGHAVPMYSGHYVILMTSKDHKLPCSLLNRHVITISNSNTPKDQCLARSFTTSELSSQWLATRFYLRLIVFFSFKLKTWKNSYLVSSHVDFKCKRALLP